MKYKLMRSFFAASIVVAVSILAGCAHDPFAGKKVITTFKGQCVKVEVGGQDFTADCLGTLVKIDHESGITGLNLYLTSGRNLIVASVDDPRAHIDARTWFARIVALISDTGERDYKAAGAACEMTREEPVPQYIECHGQAEGQALSLAFKTNGSVESNTE